jgi:signal peptidase I
MKEVNKNTEVDNTDKKLHISDVRQRLIDRVDKLKRDKIEMFGDENYVYIGGRCCRNGTINEDTSKFYLYVYGRLVKELEDILNVV